MRPHLALVAPQPRQDTRLVLRHQHRQQQQQHLQPQQEVCPHLALVAHQPRQGTRLVQALPHQHNKTPACHRLAEEGQQHQLLLRHLRSALVQRQQLQPRRPRSLSVGPVLPLAM